MRARGLRVVTSVSFAGGKDGLTAEALEQKARDLSLQSFFVARLVDVEQRSYYVPGEIYAAPHHHYRHFRHYYEPAFVLAYEPGYWASYEIAKIETNLYEAASGRLVWSAATEAVNPRSVDAVVRSLTEQIVQELERQGLL